MTILLKQRLNRSHSLGLLLRKDLTQHCGRVPAGDLMPGQPEEAPGTRTAQLQSAILGYIRNVKNHCFYPGFLEACIDLRK